MLEILLLVFVAALLSAGLTGLWLKRDQSRALQQQQQEGGDRLHRLIEATVGTTGETSRYWASSRWCASWPSISRSTRC